MMKDLPYLRHILDAILLVEEFTNCERDEFFNDRKTHSATVRQLEIIGEAVKHLSPEIRQSRPEIPWRLIAGMRDVLIHAYFKVDLITVWKVSKEDLPIIKQSVIEMIQQMESPSS